MERLKRDFYCGETKAVARAMLGCLLVHERGGELAVGRIVETEAYDGPNDKASHASRKRTKRNDVMFGPPGFTYVYLIYGMHCCLNFVVGEEGYPAAVLIRAVEPVSGIALPTSGPGRLCRALGIDLARNRLDATCGPLYLSPPERPLLRQVEKIAASPRIGVDYAGEWALAPLRFTLEGNPFVSKPLPRP